MSKTEFQLTAIDCIEGMREMAGGSIDVVVTSPPYNLGIKYNKYSDTLQTQEYLDWCAQWAAEVRRVLSDHGSFFLNVGAAPSNPLMPHELVIRMTQSGFVLQNTFHWIKSISISRDGETVSAGHFKPLNSDRFVTDCHEYVFHLTKLGQTELDRRAIGVPYTHKSNIKRWAHTSGQDLRCRGNNWFIPYKTIVSRSKERPHPATFPTELAEFCIRIHGCRPDLAVLDPFLGIGHSALAAKQCQVGRFIGFDIDAEYVETARASIQGAISTAAKKSKKAKGNDGTLLFDLTAD